MGRINPLLRTGRMADQLRSLNGVEQLDLLDGMQGQIMGSIRQVKLIEQRASSLKMCAILFNPNIRPHDLAQELPVFFKDGGCLAKMAGALPQFRKIIDKLGRLFG